VVEAAPGWTATQELQNLMAAVNAASSTPGVAAVSMSWGFSEFSGEAAYDSNFKAPGITYIAASGDSAGVLYPAASPYVLAVGGTTLNLDNSGNYVSEAAWTDSGGGYSRFEAEPGYQLLVQATGQRSVPDVAFDGDPNTGAEVYATSPRGGQGSWQVVAGTSLGAPAWAGIVAIVDQGRALAGQNSMSGATQTLPALYALASSDFHAISAPAPTFPWVGSGWSTWGFFGGGTPSGGTANTSTGLGSPSGPGLIGDLAASTVTAPFPTSSPTSSPTPAPAPTPSPIPTSHHHKRVGHVIRHSKTHVSTVHAPRVVNQHAKTSKPKVHASSPSTS
jgi:hypothetical protein